MKKEKYIFWATMMVLHRKEAKLSQSDLAKKTGISRNTISAVENCRAQPGLDVAVKICEALGVSLDYMIVDVDEIRK